MQWYCTVTVNWQKSDWSTETHEIMFLVESQEQAVNKATTFLKSLDLEQREII